MNKKKIPLQILQILEPFVSLDGLKFKRVEDNDVILHFKDLDENSDFYFYIIKLNDGNLTVSYKPYEIHSIKHTTININPTNFKTHFNLWLSLIEGYSNTKSFFDDPILNAFEEEFFTEFEIIEEEKNQPLKNNQILLIDEYLEIISSKLEEHITEESQYKIKEIQLEIKSLQENLTKETKEIVASKFSKILAKIKKLGTKYLKEVVIQTTKEIISQGIKYLINEGPNLLN